MTHDDDGREERGGDTWIVVGAAAVVCVVALVMLVGAVLFLRAPSSVPQRVVRPTAPAPRDAPPSEVAPAEVTPAELKPAELTPAEVTPAEVTPADVSPPDPPDAAAAPPTLRVRIRRLGSAVEVRVGDVVTPAGSAAQSAALRDAVVAFLAECGDAARARVEIDTGAGVPPEAVVRMVDAAIAGGVQDVTFVGTPPRAAPRERTPADGEDRR